MGTILAKDVVADVAGILQDNNAASRRWPDSDLLTYLNDGQREIAIWVPSISTEIASFKLATGTKQAVPANAISIQRFVRNMGTDGATPGKAVVACAQDDMDRSDPDWHTATADAVVQNVMYDPRLDQLNFYVSPPQPGANQGYLEVVKAVAPADATINGVNGGNADSVITLDDIYVWALKAYMQYRAFLKDGENSNPITAQLSYASFLHAIGVQPQQPQQQG